MMMQQTASRNLIFRLAVGALIFSLFAFHFPFFDVSAAHRYHTTLTRMDYNEKEKLVEISIQLFTHDLVPTLEQRAKKRVDLEKTPDVDKLIFDYLNENFVLKDKSGAAKKLNWIGKELEVDAAMIYLETPSDESLAGATLQNSLFFESFPEQTNLVTARFNGKKADLLFKVGERFQEIKETPPKN